MLCNTSTVQFIPLIVNVVMHECMVAARIATKKGMAVILFVSPPCPLKMKQTLNF